MADEEIIIDGINVGECEFSFKHFDNWVGKDVVWCDCTLSYRCEPKENRCKFYMYYLEQQLKRAEQKLEKIKMLAKKDKELAKRYNEVDTLARVVLQIIKDDRNE